MTNPADNPPKDREILSRGWGPSQYPTMLGLGFYGGFMQLGIGFLFIFTLRHLLTKNLAHVNAYKTLIIAVYTLPATLIFAWMGQIHWGSA